MSLLRRAACALALVAIAATPAPSLAAYKDRVMNREGFWGIDVDSGACAASMTVGDGSTFMLRGVDGKVTFAVFFAKPIRGGKTGQVQTEAYSFDFAPSFGDENRGIFFNGDLDNRAIAALRLAKEVRVLVDGRLVNAATFENTGFDGALDALIACSKGEKGWWGNGVGASAELDLVFNKEGYWTIVASTEGFCTAAAKVADGVGFSLVSDGQDLTFGISTKAGVKRGRKGRVETDAYSFDFRPAFDGDDYVYAEDALDSQAVFAIRRAKSMKVSIDGRAVADMTLEGTGHVAVLADLAACARGQKGWWGEGAKPAA